MKSLKIRKIELKNPQLRAIRKNLRDLLKLSILNRIDKNEGLLTAFNHSILVCSSYICASEGKVCLTKRSTDLDMVWVPWIEKWVCVNCFNKYYKDMTLDKFIENISEDPAAFDIEYMRSKFKDSFLKK
ncbi:MAG: hypothetical protein ACFFCI_08285 [Promethearchaeota archaeon]